MVTQAETPPQDCPQHQAPTLGPGRRAPGDAVCRCGGTACPAPLPPPPAASEAHTTGLSPSWGLGGQVPLPQQWASLGEVPVLSLGWVSVGSGWQGEGEASGMVKGESSPAAGQRR